MKHSKIKIRNTKRERHKNKKGNYIICVLLMLILLVGAVAGPQLLFAAQDSHAQKDIYLGERDAMDMTALNADYPKELQARMSGFAEGLAEGRNYYAYATDYEINAECYSLLDKVLLSEEWPIDLMNTQLIPDSYIDIFWTLDINGYDITAWKRYVICDEEFESGVAIMAWYFEIQVSEEQHIKLLFDTEDYSLYAIWFENIEDYYLYRFDGDYFLEAIYYWIYYYSADNSIQNIYEMYLEDREFVEANAMTDAEIAVSSITGEKYKDSKEMQKESVVIIDEILRSFMSEGQYAVPLIYGDNQLDWKMQLITDSLQYTSDFCVGVNEIWRLIPEFPQAD